MMGHHWVLSRAANEQGIVGNGAPTGPERRATFVSWLIKIVGRGESDAVTFTVASLKAGESYVFFCSFPGHGGH